MLHKNLLWTIAITGAPLERGLTRAGSKYEDFSVPFNDTEVEGVETFVAREKELKEIHRALYSDGSRRTVVLHGLGGIGKTQRICHYDYAIIPGYDWTTHSCGKAHGYARECKDSIEHVKAGAVNRG